MFSLTAEYALRAAVFLAETPTERYTTQTVADTTQIPPRYLAKVLQSLARGGVVGAQRGMNGGFTLARPPESISVYDVIQAVDPLRRIRSCPLNLEAHGDQLCPLHTHLDRAMALIEESFRMTTLADLLTRPTFRPAAWAAARK